MNLLRSQLSNQQKAPDQANQLCIGLCTGRGRQRPLQCRTPQRAVMLHSPTERPFLFQIASHHCLYPSEHLCELQWIQ